MFDAATTQLIQAAPSRPDFNPELLPQELTQAYADLAGLRLRSGDLLSDQAFGERLDRLKRLATIYEAAVDTGVTGTLAGRRRLSPEPYQIQAEPCATRHRMAAIRNEWQAQFTQMSQLHSCSWLLNKSPMLVKPLGCR